MNLKREKLELSPVYSTAMEHDGHKLGYIRLVNFSQKAAYDMQRAIDDLQVCLLLCICWHAMLLYACACARHGSPCCWKQFPHVDAWKDVILLFVDADSSLPAL